MGRKTIWIWATISALWIGYVIERLNLYCAYDGLESYCTLGPVTDIGLPIFAVLMLVGAVGVAPALVSLLLLLAARWIYRRVRRPR